MPRRREPRPTPALELKTTRIAGIQIILNSTEHSALQNHLSTLFTATPDFFGGEAAVFDCGRLPADAAVPDWAWLAQELKNRGLNQTNSTVRRLTFITTIFMPLTLLAGIGGMSEWSMMTGPANWKISYSAFMLAISVIGIANYYLLKWFEKRDQGRDREAAGLDRSA